MSRKRHESTKFMKFNSIFYKVNSRSIKEERRGCFCSMQEMLNIKEVMKKVSCEKKTTDDRVKIVAGCSIIQT